MDLDLSEDQKMLQKTARDFLANECTKQFVRQMELDEKGYSPELWRKMAELGWLGLPLPEVYEGGGGSLLDLVILLEEMGRACLPSPYLPSVAMSGLTILSAGSDDQKQRYLPAISGGEIFTFAVTESDGSYEAASIKAKATHGEGGYVISGTKLFVPYAHVADHVLCLARTEAGSKQEDGLSLFVVDAGGPGIRSAVLSTIASDKQCQVVLDGARVPQGNILGQPGGAWPMVEKAHHWAAIAKCAEMVGAAQQVLEMSVAYAKERVQFDRPIGTFQAVQHHCANMLLDVDGMRYLTYEAAWLLSSGLPAVKEVAMAKTWVSEAIGRVVRLGHQIHGGVGYTIDHDLQLYYRRGKAAQALFGDASFHREVIAGHLGL